MPVRHFGPNNEPDYLGDLLIWVADANYCIEKRTITNGTGATRDYVVGEALDGADIETATETHVDGILLERIPDLANGASTTAAVLVRGPAVIDMDEVVLNGLVKATLQTHLLDDAPTSTTSEFHPALRVITKPTNTSTGKAGN